LHPSAARTNSLPLRSNSYVYSVDARLTGVVSLAAQAPTSTTVRTDDDDGGKTGPPTYGNLRRLSTATPPALAPPPPTLAEEAVVIEKDPSALQKKILYAGELLPGVAVAGVVMQLGFWSADVLGHQIFMLPPSQPSPLSGIPVAIVLGVMANNSLFNSSVPAHLKPGLNFAKDPMLKAGIILVGIKLSLLDVASTGIMTVPAVMISIGMGMIVIPRLGNYLGLPPRMSSLIAAGSSICGVTAITALAPAINANQKETAFAVANVVAFGMMGMLCYPYAAHYIFEHSEQVGLFLGLGVHDTSQVLGASLTYREVFDDEVALQTATVTKLTRNMFLAAAIPYLTFQHAKDMATAEAGGKAPSKMSLLKKSSFVLGFIGMSCVRSAGDFSATDGVVFGLLDQDMWKWFCSYLGNELSGHYLLGTAMAAVGLNTSVKDVQGVGPLPFIVGAAGAATVAGTGMCMAFALPYCVDLGDNLIHVASVADSATAIATPTATHPISVGAAATASAVAADGAGAAAAAAAAAAASSGLPGSSLDPAVAGALLGSAGATLLWSVEFFCQSR
jgi:uncharacterized integral membrane protein (TIGR00698 family)